MRYTKSTEQTKSWKFVCTSIDPSSPSNSYVTLQDEEGRSITLPQSTFLSEYTLSPGESVALSDAVKETLALIKHYSTIRFAALAVFAGAAGALAKNYGNGPFCGRGELLVAGLLLSVVGTTFEIVLSRNLKVLWAALRATATSPPWSTVYSHRSDIAQWMGRLALVAPHLGFLFFWLYQAQGSELAFSGTVIAFAVALCTWVCARPAKLQ